ncbi:S1/P1 nuclease [Lysobacter silvisoli]|uniref:Endonuclease n=1 Tax=Lysobacter silvisoli TaxID=2293254 RepID=A0A371JZ79_9GAMM|nr:S1/P1 nuclease [Lysobacter silvisoli]RDZ26966.1 endonuclease [Lysobacter silvisoli]
MIRALLLALLLTLPLNALAWGPLGHRLVALLAWDELTPQVRADIQALLAGEADPTLAGVANWADELRANDPELGKASAKWHYVNIAQDGCVYDAARHCRNGDCVVEAIRAQTAILADRSRPREQRLQALKFVVHFVGDVHQPLHAGYGHDKGGNDLQINLDGRGSNLHALWDSGMLNRERLDEAAWLDRLRALPLAVTLSRPALPPDAAAWAEASCRIVREPGFYPPQAVIGDEYVQTWRPQAEAQLRRGGSHLAAVLNAALAR